MSETNESQSRVCQVCGKPVVDMGTGGLAHIGGGVITQQCWHCGWSGGQAGGFTNCPSCGDGKELSNEHSAS